MTTKESVLESLKRQKDAESSVDTLALKREWNEALESLFERIERWIKEAVDQKLLLVKHDRVMLSEERFGAYFASVIQLTTPSGLEVKIVPNARFAVGTQGRVDIECPPNRAILVRTGSNEWKIADLDAPRGWRLRPLTESSFWEIVGELLGE